MAMSAPVTDGTVDVSAMTRTQAWLAGRVEGTLGTAAYPSKQLSLKPRPTLSDTTPSTRSAVAAGLAALAAFQDWRNWLSTGWSDDQLVDLPQNLPAAFKRPCGKAAVGFDRSSRVGVMV